MRRAAAPWSSGWMPGWPASRRCARCAAPRRSRTDDRRSGCRLGRQEGQPLPVRRRQIRRRALLRADGAAAEAPSGREFADTLQAVWVERYPKSPFYVGDYETLVGGFRKKKFLGLCFITTAVCESEGKPDDCAELTAFRAFRDGYLKAQPDGTALIEEYYRIAPTIVMCIDVCGDRDARYAAIRKQYLQPCYNALQAGDLAGCKTKYVRMVRDLEREYLS